MGLRELEASILVELKQIANNSKIRQKDIMEWSTGEIKPEEGESHFYLPDMKIHVCVKLPVDKKKVLSATQSPLNKKQWLCELDCGHAIWVTSNRRPKFAICHNKHEKSEVVQ